jgi:hypothetical protein
LPPPPSCLDRKSVQSSAAGTRDQTRYLLSTQDSILLKSSGQYNSIVPYPTTTVHASSAIRVYKTKTHGFSSTSNVVTRVSNEERSLYSSFSEQATSLSSFTTKTRTSANSSIGNCTYCQPSLDETTSFPLLSSLVADGLVTARSFNGRFPYWSFSEQATSLSSFLTKNRTSTDFSIGNCTYCQPSLSTTGRLKDLSFLAPFFLDGPTGPWSIR